MGKGKKIERVNTTNKETWEPKTKVGKMVKVGEISRLEEILESGRPILEPGIVDVLLDGLE